MSKPWLTVEEEDSPAGTTVVVRGTFMSEAEPPVILLQSDFLTVEATLLDRISKEIIGTWDAKNVLGVNGGTWEIPENGSDASRFTLRFAPTDIGLTTSRYRETRILFLAYTYNGGSGYAEVHFPVRRRAEPNP